MTDQTLHEYFKTEDVVRRPRKSKLGKIPTEHKGNPCEVCGLEWPDVEPFDTCLGALLETYRDFMVEYAYVLEIKETLFKKVKEVAKIHAKMTGETGEIITIEGARVKVTHPKKPRVHWDGRGLEGYAVTDPNILSFRSERWAAPSVRIEVD